MDSFVKSCTEVLRKRILKDGGFAGNEEGVYRTDATAWAITAMAAGGVRGDILDAARARLGEDQHEDGRVCIDKAHPEAFWPTAIGVFAWQDSSFREQQSRAAHFLKGTTGTYWQKTPDAVTAHDTSIKGWPWIQGTHSWVEPTALSLHALEITGYQNDGRFREGIRLLLDRQLPRSGWNYGNTITFGKELRPMPDCTGIALDALAGKVSFQIIENSLHYLREKIRRVRTPFSLAWGLLGLGAWGKRPVEAPQWLKESWVLQERYGAYDTTLISVMLIANLTPSGLMGVIKQ